MELKYPIESDFIDSFINSILLNLSSNASYSIKKDAEVYMKCVNLDPIANKFSNCSASRDRVNEYIDSDDKIKEAKSAAIANCSEVIYNLYSQINSEKNDYSNALKFNQINKNKETFKSCVNDLL